MDISVFGLGYVGVVTAACLARDGHSVVGVDVSADKVDAVNAGRSPVLETGLDDLVSAAVRDKRLRATTDGQAAVAATGTAIVCVGTPSRPDGQAETRHVHDVAVEIGGALRTRTDVFQMIVRSTIPPGTMRGIVIPALERASGRSTGSGVEAIFHPEFLREGTSIHDFYHPSKIVVGERVPGAGTAALGLYDGRFTCPRIACDFAVAEMVKYCDNLFHVVKVTFANEVGLYCRAHDIDGREVMEIVCQDTTLNISTAYLQPGFAFGGSCLPKDLRAVLWSAAARQAVVPMLSAVASSNRLQIERAAAEVLALGSREIGLYGLSFKPGTDDLRESPLVELAERLLDSGGRLRIFDSSVRMACLVGGNRSYAEARLPHLARLLVDRPEALDPCAVVVLGHPAPADLVRRWERAGCRLHDLANGGGAAGRQDATSTASTSAVVECP
jgi:GDP-mannose 6-dehydrogenase